jgi:hypothetical protein
MSVLYSTGLITKLFGTATATSSVVTAGGPNGLKGLMDGGVIMVYSGAQPVNADAAITGTLLGKITKDGAAFAEGTLTNGLTLAAPSGRTVSKSTDVWKYTGSAAGTMGWARFQANAIDDDSLSTALVRIDMSVGITSGDLRMTSVTSAIGSTATIDTFTITSA